MTLIAVKIQFKWNIRWIYTYMHERLEKKFKSIETFY